MVTAAPQLITQPHCFEQCRCAFAHFRFGPPPQAPHGNHNVFLGREILHEEVKLKDKANKLVALPREFGVGQARDCLGFEHD